MTNEDVILDTLEMLTPGFWLFQLMFEFLPYRLEWNILLFPDIDSSLCSFQFSFPSISPDQYQDQP